jgi:hypothetical protein
MYQALLSTLRVLNILELLSHILEDRDVINENNLLKRHARLLKCYKNWAHYFKEFHTVLIFLNKISYS